MMRKGMDHSCARRDWLFSFRYIICLPYTSIVVLFMLYLNAINVEETQKVDHDALTVHFSNCLDAQCTYT